MTDAIDANSGTALTPRSLDSQGDQPVSRGLVVAIALFALVATLAGAFSGPALGDHEALVASCARNMRVSGDWITPQFLETPFIRKSPLPYWTVAAMSYLTGNHAGTGLPVSVLATRLPNAIFGFLTVVCLWILSTSMFSRRAGAVTAVVSASSIAVLLYSPNATAEMPLMFGCTWAFLHFWLGVNATTTRGNFIHMMMFYVALGVAMLGKGPQPVNMVGLPLAVWWFTQRPLRILAGGGHTAWRKALAAFVRDLKPRAIQIFTRLWFFPGILIFALMFVPWMLAVASRNEHAWDIWNWQYLQRVQGDFPDTRHRGILYYLPIIGGLVLPWTFLSIEAAIAPWSQRYARWRKGMLYAGLWVLIGVGTMSLMEFKKPYYVLAAAPGFLLLVGAVADWFFCRDRQRSRTPGSIGIGIVVQVAALLIGAMMWYRDNPSVGMTATAIGIGWVLVLAAATVVVFRRGRGWTALAIPAIGTVLTFHVVWFAFGSSLDNVDKVALLARQLDEAGLPKDADLQWADSRPDSRLGFYFGRRSRHMLTPEEIVARTVDRKADKHMLARLALERATELLAGDAPVYLIIERKNYNRAGPTLPKGTRIFTTASMPDDSVDKDWVVVTNAAPR